ncbi:restriction endonuclease subunit S [Microbacterium sp. NPDC055312]
MYKNDSITRDLTFMRATATPDQIERFRLEIGDTIITKDSETADDIGIPAYVEFDAPDLVCGYHLTMVRPTNTAVPRFVYWALRSEFVLRQWSVLASGVTRVALRRNDVARVTVPIPPVPDQQRVADYLDRETAQIDALIAKQEQLIATLRERRESEIDSFIGQGSTGMIRLKRLATIRYGLGEPPLYHREGTALIRATNIDAGRITSTGLVYVDPADIPAARIQWLEADDIVVVRSGALTGDSSRVGDSYAGAIAGFDMILRPLDRRFSRFLSYALLARSIRAAQVDQLRTRAAQPHLNAQELGNVLVPIQPAEKAEEVGLHLDERTAKIDILVAKAERFIELSKERRAALITAAVTGQLEIPG